MKDRAGKDIVSLDSKSPSLKKRLYVIMNVTAMIVGYYVMMVDYFFLKQ